MTNLRNLIARRDLLDKTIAEYEQLIRNAPEGELIIRRRPSGNYSYTRKFRLSDGSVKEHYLGQATSPEVTSLAKKRYAQKILPSLKQEQVLLNKLIVLRMKDSAADNFLRTHPGFLPLLQSSADKNDVNEWKNAPYDRNMNYPDQLRFSTVVPGLMVRSKAEADIVSRLEHYGVPYHYEEIQTIGGVRVAMDFTCRNLSTKQILFWDHRGMLDNPAYIQKTLNCDALFLKEGIIPWMNLIITTETKDCPLDLQWVDTIIRHYLL